MVYRTVLTDGCWLVLVLVRLLVMRGTPTSLAVADV